MLAARFSVAVLFATVAACAGTTEPSPAGDWGGTDASLTLTRAGGSVSYACGAGTIDSAWSVDRGGRFRAQGRHAFAGGPMPIGGFDSEPAQYEGWVRGDVLVFTVTLPESGQVLGPYRLTRGGPPVANICV